MKLTVYVLLFVIFVVFTNYHQSNLNEVSILCKLEFVTGGVELLKAVLHGYAGGLIFMK